MRQYLRVSTLLTVLALLFFLAACGSDDDADDDAGDTGGDSADDASDASDDGDGEAGDGDAGDGDAGDGDGGDDMSDFDAEEYFTGKSVRFVTSSGAGGGTDQRIRAFASQITRFLPGDPGFQVSNVTPHVAGMNFLWNQPPDGLTVMMTAAPTLEFEFFEGADWDSREFEYVGTLNPVCDNMLLVRGNLGYDSIEDVSGGDEPLVTMTAAPSPDDVEPIALGVMLLADILDWPLEVKRVAESGSAALFLALERGEINTARSGTEWCRIAEDRPDWFEEEFVLPMLDMGTGGPGSIPESVAELGYDPPHISDLLTEEEYERYTGIVTASRAGGVPIFLPPDTPEEIVEVWRDAFVEAYADEEYVEVMERTYGGEEFRILTGEEAEALFTENLELMEQYRPEFQQAADEVFEKYVN